MVLIAIYHDEVHNMLHAKISWNLKTVLSLHILRLVIGLVLVRLLYPYLFTVTPFIVEVTDRLVVLTLVWLTVYKYGGDFKSLGLSFHHLGRNILKGIAAGFILLLISTFSERLYIATLYITPTQHPLVVQVENARTWRELIMPLFLAGILAPFTEEILYRLFTFLPMKERWGLWGGAIGSSLVFALMHFNLYWLGEMMVVGVGLALLYVWTGSLLSGIVAHSLVNTAKILMVFNGISFL